MSYMDEYNKLKKKRLQEEAKASPKVTNSGGSSYMNEYNKLRDQRTKESVFDSVIRRSISLDKKDRDEETKSKKEEDDSKLDFFQKGSFDDGYQAGDVTKAILGTAGDAGMGIVKGIGKLGEGIGDLVSYGIIGAADLFGASDEWVADKKKRTQDSFVDIMAKPADDYLNKYSVLGRTSDAVMQGLGQVGGILATGGLGAAAELGTAGTTALTTAVTGLSGVGSGMGEAYQGGATDKEALTYGLISGTADAVSELIFGGLGKAVKATGLSVGLSSADDMLAKKLTKKVSSTLAKNVIELGVKSGAEGLEEVLAGTAQAVGKKLTYMSESDIMEIIEDENLLEQFVVGAFTSGIAQSPSVSNATTQGRDYISGLTKNEETVINKVYEDTVAEKEKNGNLTTREKNKIYDSVVKDMELGRIDTDTIESVLGGESYSNYQSMVEKETSLKKQSEDLTNEINTLLDKENPTMRDSERLAEARKELDQVKTDLEGIDTKTAKINLFTEVDKLTANDTKLRESYYEKENRGKAFEADLTKYDAKQQETIKKAVESGILNNTRRTHEFVDLVAKISADKGVLFDFTNNQKLKESGFAIDGKQVNGFVTKDGVTLNVNSAKSLDTVVGHEIAHVLEGTELYNELQTVIVEYAKSKNDYQGRYDALTKLYEGIEGANIDSELTAELVGDYIFTDTDFIHNLSTNHRNVFQKVYDEVKYLYKVATAGSKEAKQLERVKKLFDEAYRGEPKNTADGGVKYSLLVKDKNGNVSTVNPYATTRDQTRDYMVKSRKGELDQYTYFPVSAHTPGTVIATLNNAGIGISDKPLAMQAKKARQSQIDGEHTEPDGTVIRHHAMSTEEIQETIDKLSEPFAVIHQTERTKTTYEDGKKIRVPAPDNFVFFVTLDSGKETVAVVEFDSVINENMIQRDGQGDEYHTTVTVFEPDKYRDGEEFDYLEYLAIKPANIELKITKESPKTETAISQTEATVSESELSAVNVAEKGGNVKPQFSLSNDVQVEEIPLEQRISGDDLLDAQDMITEIEDVAEISQNGYVTVYHRTTEENAKKIMETGKMSAKEDGIFFSTQKDGEYSSDYGSSVVTLKVPVEKFVLDDIFDTEAHLRIPLKSRKEILDVSAYISSQPDMNLSLSEKDAAPTGKFLGKDMALETVAETTDTEADIAPTPATISETETVEDYAPGESLEEQLAKADESVESLDTETEALFRDLSEQKITEAEFAEKWHDLDKRYTQARQEQERLSAEMTDINNRKYESLDDSDIPPEAEAPYYGEEEAIAPVDPFAQRDMNEVGKRSVKAYMHENPEVKPFFQDAARVMLFDLQNSTKGERLYNDQLYYESGGEHGWMGTSRRTTSDIADLLDHWGYTYAQIEAGLNAIIEGNGKENNAVSKRIEFMLDNRLRNGYKDVDGRPIPADEGYINLLKEKQIDDDRRESFDSFMEVADQYAPPVEDIAPVKEVATVEDVAPLKIEPATEGEQDVLDGFEQEQKPERLTRAKLHSQIVDRIKSVFTGKGIDFDKVLDDAHRMNALSINDNTPQRVNDKTFGYEAGEALNEITFNKVALNESNGVKWLNEQVDTIRNLSKKYKIKPLSKESAAAQMYAEGFWVNDKDEIIAYGDAELAQDFPDVQVQRRIKALANDPVVRQIYDNTLSAINESRKRNAYPEIPRLENYFLHFRAMDDTFSRLGVPFNPNDIKAKDLPTDINGTTIDRKPGQPFFASSMHREGKRTSFDLLGGVEKYLNSAKNQIYHIDDIQTARALWGYIADRYGQAHGLENLDDMAFEAQQEHIQKVYDGHLSNYARFLVEYGNHLAGKTALIDRGVEGLIGRRALQFINTVNMQTSRNQVGYSISSPLTNFIPSMEAIARTSKRDSIKAFAQTVSNVFRKDGFVESDPTLIRRRGTDKFAKTLWDKMSDPGFILMGAVDNVTSEFIVRTKYNELTRKGMDSKQAHIKAGEWASRIMGDRSLGQMPLHYNSKFMGLFTKYQLEVRNALDSQFYDTYQEAKANTKEVENQKAKNALTATKFAYRAVQIAALNHVFGMAFEKIAGYNPAFDIISTIATLFGWDDDEEDEDTFGDNAEQAFKELLGDLPYTSLFTDGGRIPIGSAMPIKQLISGIDKYGNEKSRLETLAEAAPYYLLPGGYGQIKKTTQGLGMFSDEHPVSGSYTDSGNLRFPVEETFGNKLQAAVFGQYASENARDYFDNERSPLKEKQIQEYIDVDIPIKDYWDYREGLAKLKTNEDKVDYIDSLDLPLSKKNILVNNVLDRKEDVDLADYGEYGSLEEFDFAVKYPEKYQFFEEIGVTYEAYSTADDDTKDAYNWAFQNPDKYTVSKAIADDVVEYKSYTKGLSEIEADKDENGKSINGSRKEKVFNYIESLPIDYGQKCVLFKSQYKADDSMNMDIIEYLDSREDIDYEAMVTILKELDFTVEGNNVYWD